MTAWALLGNTLYNGLGGRFFNWFFVVRDPFYILPEAVAPFVMPFVMVAVMFTGELLIRAAYHLVKRIRVKQYLNHPPGEPGSPFLMEYNEKSTKPHRQNPRFVLQYTHIMKGALP